MEFVVARIFLFAVDFDFLVVDCEFNSTTMIKINANPTPANRMIIAVGSFFFLRFEVWLDLAGIRFAIGQLMFFRDSGQLCCYVRGGISLEIMMFLGVNRTGGIFYS